MSMCVISDMAEQGLKRANYKPVIIPVRRAKGVDRFVIRNCVKRPHGGRFVGINANELCFEFANRLRSRRGHHLKLRQDLIKSALQLIVEVRAVRPREDELRRPNDCDQKSDRGRTNFSFTRSDPSPDAGSEICSRCCAKYDNQEIGSPVKGFQSPLSSLVIVGISESVEAHFPQCAADRVLCSLDHSSLSHRSDSFAQRRSDFRLNHRQSSLCTFGGGGGGVRGPWPISSFLRSLFRSCFCTGSLNAELRTTAFWTVRWRFEAGSARSKPAVPVLNRYRVLRCSSGGAGSPDRNRPMSVARLSRSRVSRTNLEPRIGLPIRSRSDRANRYSSELPKRELRLIWSLAQAKNSRQKRSRSSTDINCQSLLANLTPSSLLISEPALRARQKPIPRTIQCSCKSRTSAATLLLGARRPTIRRTSNPQLLVERPRIFNSPAEYRLNRFSDVRVVRNLIDFARNPFVSIADWRIIS